MKEKIKWTAFFLLFVLNLHAQDSEDDEIKAVFRGTRFVHAQSSNLAEPGDLILLIQHRFGDISEGMYEFFGLDQATMRLGFEYGVAKFLTVGIGRSSMFKTYDGALKFRLFQQTTDFPLTIAATFGASLPTEKNYFPEQVTKFSDKYSGNAQLHLAKTMGVVSLLVSPGYLYTGYYKDSKTNSYKNLDVITLGLGGSVKLAKNVTLNLEYLHNFNDRITAMKALSAGVDLVYGEHLFQLMVTNSQAMFNQALYTNTMGDWSKGNIYFGFNLIRKFRLKYNDDYF